MAKKRDVREPLAHPKNQKEYAERSQVIARYMTMGFWTPRSERKKR